MHQRQKAFTLLVAATIAAASNAARAADAPAPAPFIHPGLLQSAADLARIRENVHAGKEPWASAWKAFNTKNRWISPSYKPRPLAIVGRGVGATGQAQISNDCTAAYYNAIAWVVTGDEAYANKSIEIMDAWASTCHEINGKDADLCAGIYGYKLMNAAEIIRATYPGWSPREIDQFKHLARDVFYPVIKDFATYANGNWDASAEAAMLAIGVFLDDRPMFDRAVRYYLAGSGDGTIPHYIVEDSGELQETGRDQGHAQLGIGLLSCVAEMAWHQGIDLYAADDNRLLKGFEYTAKYNLGGDIPFVPSIDRTGKYNHNRPSPRGKLNMLIYEMVYNHYVHRMNIPAPFTAQAAALQRPEALAIDQVGAGTLLFSLPPYHPAPPSVAPACPTLLASSCGSRILLQWPASIGAGSYTLRRADNPQGLYDIISGNVSSLSFLDTPPEKNHVFYYRIAARNGLGESPESLPVSACAGLPAPWTAHDIGSPVPPGHTNFDGATFTLEAAGKGIDSDSDELYFTSLPLPNNATLTARYVPQTPSQFASFGLMIRDSLAPDAMQASLLLTPHATTDIEMPRWHAELIARSREHAPADVIADSGALGPPTVTWGRLMAPLWLRLERSGSTIRAAISTDEHTWAPVGSTTLPLSEKAQIGLAAGSAIQTSTTVMFDHVTLTTPPAPQP